MRHVGDPFQVGGNETAPLLELEQGVLQRVQRLLQRLPLLFVVAVHVVLVFVLLLQRLLSGRQLGNVWPVSTAPELVVCRAEIFKFLSTCNF